jgi:hypothetical protein
MEGDLLLTSLASVKYDTLSKDQLSALLNMLLYASEKTRIALERQTCPGRYWLPKMVECNGKSAFDRKMKGPTNDLLCDACGKAWLRYKKKPKIT